MLGLAFGGSKNQEKDSLMSSNEIIIDVANLSKRYEIYSSPRDRLKQLVLPALYSLFYRFRNRLGAKIDSKLPQYFREFWALHDVSFQVFKGETLGIIGLNGSGKSTLLQMICSTLTPTSGNVEVKGRVAALLELGSGFNPDFTGRENVYLNGQILGLSREEVENKFKSIEEFADIGDFIDQPVKTYSSGMSVRLAFAVAISVEPEVLVVDEALAVGDMAFQRKCLRWMEDFAARRGVLLFVSHSPEQVRRLCTKAIYLRNGVVVGIGQAKEICDKYEKDQYITSANGEEKSTLKLTTDYLDIDVESERESQVGFAECALHYGDDRVRITGAWVEDLNGFLRSSFKVGEGFSWCYRVEFNCFAEDVVFGFMVKTKEGISLFGANSQTLGYEPIPVVTGNSIVVRFSIEPNLGAGEYFLNCGVSIESSGQSEFLHRVIDAGIIVISANEKLNSGIVNMKAQMHLKSNSPENINIR